MQDYATVQSVPFFGVYDDPNETEIEHVAAFMRSEDIEECRAWNITPEEAGEAMARTSTYSWVVYQRDEPVFLFGLKQGLPGSYFLGGFGSRVIQPRTLRALTRWGVQSWLPQCFGHLAVRRLEAFVPVQSVHSIDWLMRLGMRHEGRHHGFVNEGDHFLSLAYTVSDHDRITNDVYVP